MGHSDPRPRPAVSALNLASENRVRLGRSDALLELRDDLMRASYQPGQVHLDSGVQQPYFLDKYLMFARPSILRRLGRFMSPRVPEEVERLASPTLGAVLLGTAVALESGLPLAVVRTDRGCPRGQAVEGGLHQGETVAVIEDVVVTGSRALQTVERLRDEGAQVANVLCVVDCERDAGERLSAAGVSLSPLFTYSALSSFLERR
jgi:orotate phosphoribosyltransferase